MAATKQRMRIQVFPYDQESFEYGVTKDRVIFIDGITYDNLSVKAKEGVSKILHQARETSLLPSDGLKIVIELFPAE